MIAEPSAAVHLRALDPFDFLTNGPRSCIPTSIAVIDGDRAPHVSGVRGARPPARRRLQRAGMRAVSGSPCSRRTRAWCSRRRSPSRWRAACCARSTRAWRPTRSTTSWATAARRAADARPRARRLVERLATRLPRVRAGAPAAGGALDYERLLDDADVTALRPRAAARGRHDLDQLHQRHDRQAQGRHVHASAAPTSTRWPKCFTPPCGPESVYLWTLPMFHCNGWCFPWAVTAAGATHVTCARSTPPGSTPRSITKA
jgi:hypothetical protein